VGRWEMSGIDSISLFNPLSSPIYFRSEKPLSLSLPLSLSPPWQGWTAVAHEAARAAARSGARGRRTRAARAVARSSARGSRARTGEPRPARPRLGGRQPARGCRMWVSESLLFF